MMMMILPGSSSDTNATSGGVCTFSNIEVDEDVDVIEEIFISINEEVDRGIKQEEIPGDITFPDIKSEPDKGTVNEHLHVQSDECRYSCDIHRGERPYPCEVCNKAFSTKGSLNKTTDVVFHQQSRRILKMDILMSETC
jgi:hypothetical protein